MNKIHEDGGFVVSVTTDGFITDLKDLEFYDSGRFSKIYKKARENLSNNNCILELKHTEEVGLLSWKTRGQMGMSSNIKAFSGYQDTLPIDERRKLFLDTFENEKTLKFIQFSLRGATDITKSGFGAVTPVYQETTFSLIFDDRREILTDNANHPTY